MKLEITCAVSSKKDLIEYIKQTCKSAEDCGITDNVTLKVAWYDAEKLKPYEDFFSMFSK